MSKFLQPKYQLLYLLSQARLKYRSIWYTPDQRFALYTSSRVALLPSTEIEPRRIVAIVRTFDGRDGVAGFTRSCVGLIRDCPTESKRSQLHPPDPSQSTTTALLYQQSIGFIPANQIALDPYGAGYMSPPLTDNGSDDYGPCEEIAKFFDSFNAVAFRGEYGYRPIGETPHRLEEYISACAVTSGPDSISTFVGRLSELLPPEVLRLQFVHNRVRSGLWPPSPTRTHLVDAALKNPACRNIWEKRGLIKITEPQAEAFMRQKMYEEFYDHISTIRAIRQSHAISPDRLQQHSFPTVSRAYEALPLFMDRLGLDEHVKAQLCCPVLLMEYVKGRPLSTIEEAPTPSNFQLNVFDVFTPTIIRSQAQAVGVVEQVLQALHEGWNAHLEYTDWRLDNIVQAADRSVIVDLGGFIPFSPNVDASDELLSAYVPQPDFPDCLARYEPDSEIELTLVELIASRFPTYLGDQSTHASFITQRFRRFPDDPRTTFRWQSIMQSLTSKARSSHPWSKVDVTVELLRFAKQIMNEELKQQKDDWHFRALTRIRQGLLDLNTLSSHDSTARHSFKQAHRTFNDLLAMDERPAMLLDYFWLPARLLRNAESLFIGDWSAELKTAEDNNDLRVHLLMVLRRSRTQHRHGSDITVSQSSKLSCSDYFKIEQKPKGILGRKPSLPLQAVNR